MTNEQRTVLLEHIKNIMTELDTRHAREMGELVSRHQAERRKKESEMSGLSAGLNDDAQPALFVVPVVASVPVTDRPFPDEQHLYKGGRLDTMRNGEPRPKRWREDAMEYFYTAAGRVTRKTKAGTAEFLNGIFCGRWFTVDELNARQDELFIMQGKKK
jgi:hypothetical protein